MKPKYQTLFLIQVNTDYSPGMNGILADEMGLGKTIQSIGMIAKLIEHGVPGTFLVYN